MENADAFLEAVQLLDNLDHLRNIRKLQYYEPYPYQKEFHNARGKGTTEPAKQRLLCAANKCGKTHCAAMEVAYHATGEYPDWWEGTRFARAPEIIVCGVTNDSVRDIGQMELCGDPTDKTKLGTGSIPKAKIGKVTTKNGVTNAYDTVLVKHVSGQNSRIYFRAYEQGWKKFQGIAFEVCWPDEEPPPEIWSQLIRAGLARKGAIILCTMTPEEGMTELVTQFMEDLKVGQAMITATWWDVTHITDIDQKLQALRPHEREMRSRGIPLMGAGLVFPVPDDELMIDPFDIPRHWPQIIGIDFGISTQHPFSAVRWAIDRDNNVKYIISEYTTTNAEASVHVDSIKKWGDWIPVAWPHDGLNREKGSGDELQKVYRDKGLTNLLPWKATNPPDGSVGQMEGDGGNSLEKSLLSMLDDMYLGKIKVFSTCQQWFKEKRMYHRDLNAKLVKQWEDCISACLHPDTRVVTRNGLERIVDLVGTTGEVLSNGKWANYSRCFKTRRNAPLVEVEFEDGYTVLCTAEHRFMTDKGWVEAQDLEGELCHNAVSSSVKGPVWKWLLSLNQSSGSMACVTENIAAPSIFPKTEECSIARSGLSIAARYLLGITSIIKTVTRQITNSPIWSWLKHASTCRSTQSSIPAARSKLSKPLNFGEKPLLGSPFSVKWAREIIASCGLYANSFVNAVAMNSRDKMLAPTGFVQIPVNQSGEGLLDWTISQKNANSAAMDLLLASSIKAGFVPSYARGLHGEQPQKARHTLRVLRVKSAGKSDVYCLSVPETEAFALENGTLVHNSRYGHMMIRHARVVSVLPRKQTSNAVGVRNW